jgi:hypothetical protein
VPTLDKTGPAFPAAASTITPDLFTASSWRSERIRPVLTELLGSP